MAFPDDQSPLRKPLGISPAAAEAAYSSSRQLATVPGSLGDNGYRPNFTAGQPTPNAALAGPGSAVGPANYKPNFTMGGNAPAGNPSPPIPPNVANPNVAPDRLGSLREAIKTPANSGPQVPAGGLPSAAEAAPSRMASLRGGVNSFFGAGESAGSVGGAFKNVASPILNAGKSALGFAAKYAAPVGLGAAAAQGLSTDTEDYAKRFGLENTEPGLGRDLGIRALGVASDIGNDMTFGMAKKYLYRDGENGDLPQSLRQAPAAAPAPNTFSPGDATMPGQDLGRTFGAAQAPGQAPVGEYTPGYKNTDIRRVDGGSSPLFTNMPDGGRLGNDALMGRKPMSAQNQAAFDAMGDRANMEGMALAQYRASGGSGGQGGGLRGQLERQLSGKTLNKNGAAVVQGLDQNDVQLRGNQMQYETAMRGQDVAREGHILTNETSRNRLRQDQFQSDRTYGAGRTDAATARDKTNFDESQAAQKNLTDRIGNMTLAGADGKPDTVTIARHVGQVNALVSSQMDQLKQHLTLNPGDQTAASALAGLQARGPAQLGEDQIRNSVLSGRLIDIANATHTSAYNPMGSKAVAGDKPITSLKDDGSGNYITNRGDVIPHRFINREGSTLSWGGKASSDYDHMKIGAK